MVLEQYSTMSATSSAISASRPIPSITSSSLAVATMFSTNGRKKSHTTVLSAVYSMASACVCVSMSSPSAGTTPIPPVTTV